MQQAIWIFIGHANDAAIEVRGLREIQLLWQWGERVNRESLLADSGIQDAFMALGALN